MFDSLGLYYVSGTLLLSELCTYNIIRNNINSMTFSIYLD